MPILPVDCAQSESQDASKGDDDFLDPHEGADRHLDLPFDRAQARSEIDHRRLNRRGNPGGSVVCVMPTGGLHAILTSSLGARRGPQ